jgi:hypothetical protein
MASIGADIKRLTSKHNKPGGRASASHKISKTKNRGNKGSFGNAKNSKNVKSINTGGNYGTLGY